MATAATFRCPLCLKSFYQPKLLEKCMHSFCRICICIYVKPFLSIDQRENKIPCSICKTPFLGPVSFALLEEWLDHLPSDPLLLQLIGDNSRDKTANCEPCTLRGKHSQASSKCKECQERLCGQCSEVHRSFKGTRTHTLIDIGSSNGSDDIQPPRCEHHTQKDVEYYCKDHDELLCSKCAVLRHRSCGILELETASESMLQNVSIAKIRSSFQTLKTDIETENTTAQKERDKFQDQVRKALLDVEDKRKKVNVSFDRYKANIAETTQDHLEQANEVKTVDEKIATGIDNSLILLDTAQSGNYIQLYLRCKAMKRQVDGYRKQINNCNSMCKKTQLEYSFSAYVTSIINEFSLIGTFQMSATESNSTSTSKMGNTEIQETHAPSVSSVFAEQTEYVEEETIEPTVGRDRIASSIEKPREKCKVGLWGLTIDPKLRPNVRVKTTRTLEIVLPDGSKPFFGGAAYLNDERVVLTDVKYHRLILLDNDLKYLTELELERRPRKVTLVDTNQVAVGLSNAKKVLIINVGSKEMAISRCIYTHHLSKCVIGNNQRLFMSSYDGRLENECYLTCFNLQNDEETFIENIQGMYDARHIAIMNRENRSYIIHSCRNDDTIKCHADNGEEIFSYKLLGPGGIDVDRYGNIFVSSSVRHKIIHLSPTGNLIQILEVGYLCKPFEVRMNAAEDKILVTQFESSEVHLIGLSYQ